MKNGANISQNDKKNKRTVSAEIMMLICCSAFFSLLTFILSPIYSAISANIVFYTTLLPDILDVLIQLLEIAAFASCYSIVILSVTAKGASASCGVCWIYVAACTVRRAAAAVITYIQYGSLPSEEVASLMLYLSLETVQIFLVLLFAYQSSKNWRASVKAAKKAALKTGGSVNADISLNPAYSSINPLKNTAFKAGVMLAVIKILSRIVYDVTYGAPNGLSEILIMTVYYLSDVLIAIIFYAMCLFIMKWIYNSVNVSFRDK